MGEISKDEYEVIWLQERPILSVKNLSTHFKMVEGVVKAVQDATFDLYRDEVLGIVGETGSGKSVTVKAIAGMIDKVIAVVASRRLRSQRFTGQRYRACT